ncbi:hypothetical protein COO60DRAFT_755567 [Scenedesmus sp. NREL 46B-D3]|nr:hypothetical protein COO60DRAFT_755567 [Scenedesmus sp. NREL 46B-D3]
MKYRCWKLGHQAFPVRYALVCWLLQCVYVCATVPSCMCVCHNLQPCLQVVDMFAAAMLWPVKRCACQHFRTRLQLPACVDIR